MADRRSITSRHLPLYEGGRELKLRTWVQLVRTFYLIQRRVVSALLAHEMTLPQFDVMATLRFSEGVSQQELAKRLLVTKGNVCGVVDRLETAGWVQRRSDPEDARTNRLHLTPAGKRKIEAVFPDHDAVVLHAMHSVSESDAKVLRGLLGQLADANEQSA